MNRKQKKWFSLSKKKDFLLLKRNGRRLKREGFFIIYLKNELSLCRFGLSFPRWTGNAVHRSRFKRWARHFLKEKEDLKGVDLMLGFEKREKDFYKNMKYESFCIGFEKLYRLIQL